MQDQEWILNLCSHHLLAGQQWRKRRPRLARRPWSTRRSRKCCRGVAVGVCVKRGEHWAARAEIGGQWLPGPACGPVGKLGACTCQPGGDLMPSPTIVPSCWWLSSKQPKSRACPESQEQAWSSWWGAKQQGVLLRGCAGTGDSARGAQGTWVRTGHPCRG